MSISQALLGVIAGGGLAIVGTWLGARWQAKEARRVRLEQYAREDKLRDQSTRRETYVQFARRADDGVSSTLLNEDANRELAGIVVALDRQCWELELVASPRVIAAARQVVSAVDDARKNADEGWAAIEVFIREARRELGLQMQDMPPLSAWEWVNNRRRVDYSGVLELSREAPR
jgi:hypothetical protein